MDFNVIEIILFYVFLIVFVKFNKRIFLLLCLFIVLIDLIFPYLDCNSIVYFFDVNQGDSSLIVTPYRKEVIMIDTGGIKGRKVSDNVVSFLKNSGINAIDYLILTHGDFDHMGDAISLVENFKVENVIFNCGELNELEMDLIKVLDRKKISYYSCIKELYIEDNNLYFLNNKDYGNENDNSSVIYTELSNYRFLFMGDAGADVEEDLMVKYNFQDIDVLKIGHHGSKTSSGKEFINAINPRYSLISVGENNRYGHPNKEVLENLKESKIYRTDLDGSILFKIKNNKINVETFAP